MAFRVELSARALADADAILAWLYEKGAGRAGVEWFLALEDAIASLEQMPNRCPLAPESIRYDYEVRELRYGRKPNVYRILFSVVANVVEVKHIRHARRLKLT